MNTALLVIDVQQGLFWQSRPVFRAAALLAAINLLIDRAHEAQIPVFFFQHTNPSSLQLGHPGWQLHPDLHRSEHDQVLTKRHGSIFHQTELQVYLDTLKVKRVVVAGLVTHGCVQAACHDAHKLGYRVVLVEDGHSNWNRNALRLITEWNEQLRTEGIAETHPAQDILFTPVQA